MSRTCDLTGTGVMTGNKVSHSNRKSRRRFMPNLQVVSFQSDALNQQVKLRVTAATIRTVDHNGGLDDYLLSTADAKLTEEAVTLKRRIKRAIAKKAA